MDLGLKDKVALVVAASRGLGKATALELAREGAQVIVTARGEADLQAAAREIRRLTGAQVLALHADLGVEKDVEDLVRAAKTVYGRIDILVNNAGGPKSGQFTDVSDDDWFNAINLNLMSAIRLTRLVLPGMRGQRWGRIINITSVSAKQPMPTLILSNAARSGIVAMAKTLASEVAAEGITVNNVCPGYTLTDRVRDLAAANAKAAAIPVEQVMAQWEASIPARRLGKPEELAALVAFLASERASYITGTTIQVDGGYIQGLF